MDKIRAPIDGVVGISKAQIGDLIDANSELTSMSTLDPIRVYFPVSEQEYFEAADKIQQGYKDRRDGKEYRLALLELVLGGEKVYPHKGQFHLVDRQVDQKTGTIRVAALFPNPRQFVKARPIRPSTGGDQDQGGSDPRPAARRHGDAGQSPGGGCQSGQQGGYSSSQGWSAVRKFVDH